MRSIFWCSILSAALLGGTACKKHDDGVDKAGTEVKKAQEKVDDKSDDVRKTEIKANEKLDKQNHELEAAKDDLVKARTDFTVAVQARLAKLDAKLDMLAAKTDAKSKEIADNVRTRRALLASKLDDANTRVQANWDSFKQDVDGMFTAIEHDLDDATK